MRGKRVLVTGGAGFLGSHFVRRCLERGAAKVHNLDCLTYAGDLTRLIDVEHDDRYTFIHGDASIQRDVHAAFRQAKPEVVVHFAAESHVTRAEVAGDEFYTSNVEATRVVLEACASTDVASVIHISTDEVYGPVLAGEASESDKPPGDGHTNHVYARTKAVADDLALGWSDRLPVIVVRPTNIFGPHQFPEKAIPRWITRALTGRPVPVWGGGHQMRQWLEVTDLLNALEVLLDRGESGRAYNVGPVPRDVTNLEVAQRIASRAGAGESHVELTAYDRPNHDVRYAVASDDLRELGWSETDLWSALDRTIDWYAANADWWRDHLPVAESIYEDSNLEGVVLR